jgi:hypothetical protein
MKGKNTGRRYALGKLYKDIKEIFMQHPVTGKLEKINLKKSDWSRFKKIGIV